MGHARALLGPRDAPLGAAVGQAQQGAGVTHRERAGRQLGGHPRLQGAQVE